MHRAKGDRLVRASGFPVRQWELLVNFFRNGGAFIGNVVRQWA